MPPIPKELFMEALRNIAKSGGGSSTALDFDINDFDEDYITEFLKPKKFSPFPQDVVMDGINNKDDFIKILREQFQSLKSDAIKTNKRIENLKPVPNNVDLKEISEWFGGKEDGKNKDSNTINNENLFKLGASFFKNLNKQQKIIEEYNNNGNDETTIAKSNNTNNGNGGKEEELTDISNNVDRLQKEMEGLQEFVYDMTKNMGLSNELFNDIKKKKKKKKKKSNKQPQRQQQAQRQQQQQNDEDENDIILATKDIWICEFCEYERVFGEKPREMIKWYKQHVNDDDKSNNRKQPAQKIPNNNKHKKK